VAGAVFTPPFDHKWSGLEGKSCRPPAESFSERSNTYLKRKKMAFDAKLEMVDVIAKISLSGELDAATAPAFRAAVEEAVGQDAQRLVLLMYDLEYMASAGLRVLIFAKQKMGADADVYIIGAQEPVYETITMTGFHHGVIMLEEYDPAEIENI
jgi:anti-anti-sigma factor